MHYHYCAHFSAEFRFDKGIYSVNEIDGGVDVCIRLMSGTIDVNDTIILLLTGEKFGAGGAEGEPLSKIM